MSKLRCKTKNTTYNIRHFRCLNTRTNNQTTIVSQKLGRSSKHRLSKSTPADYETITQNKETQQPTIINQYIYQCDFL